MFNRDFTEFYQIETRLLPQKTLPFIGIIPKNLLYVKYFRYFAVNTINIQFNDLD